MNSAQIGKWLLVTGLALAAVGALVWLAGATGLPLGRLPGDVNVERDRFSFHVPIVTCIVLSILLTIVINLLLRFFGK